MIRFLLSFVAIIIAALPISAQVVANFTAEECSKEIFRNGFDSQAELDQLTLSVTNKTNTWHVVAAPRANVIPPFTSVNPKSVASMAVWYDTKVNQDESFTTPYIDIAQNSKCSFYACFDGVFIMYSNFKLIATQEDGTATTIFDAFLWSQESGHEKPKWLPFSVDLSQYAGQKVKFTFSYKGVDGDDVLVDDFVITQPDISGQNNVTIIEGEEVHFVDSSTGNPNTWMWNFEGADILTSTEPNPVVKYSKAGTYKVSLVVKDATSQSEKIREGFVIVKGQAPTAKLSFPKEGYLSPWAAIFIPRNTPVTFEDQSKGNPSEWAWKFTGANLATSTEQNPTVTYAKTGMYSVALTVKNSIGTSDDIYENAIQVGGKQNIWNIEMNETSGLAPVDLSWYGWYGGTNYLGMLAFAEYFNKPIVKGNISSVDIYFSSINTVSPNAEITVSITESENGLPGKVLGSAKVLASELKYDETTFVPTQFIFDTPVSIDKDFFVTIAGIPNATQEESPYESDNIAMFCSPKRADGGKSTIYHFLEGQDDNGNPTGKNTWEKNVDEFLSFAIAPMFEYSTELGVESNEVAKVETSIFVANEMLQIKTTGEISSVEVYNISGQLINTSVSETLSISSWNKGIYIVKAIVDGKPVVAKVII